MKFRLQCKRALMVFAALMTVILAFCFVSPVSADQTTAPTTATSTTNQPNAPNKGSQPAGLATQSPVVDTNAAQNNQSTTELNLSDVANDPKSATTAIQFLNSNLSAAGEGGQETPNQPTGTRGSNTVQQLSPDITAVGLINGVTGEPVRNGELINQFTPLRFELDWSLMGTNVYPGDYFTFSIPDTLSFTGALNFTTNLGEGQIIGNAGRFTFKKSASDAYGKIYLTVQLNGDKVDKDHDVPITINVNGQSKLSLNVKYAPGQVSPDELFSKYAMNDNLDNGNLAYALRINPSGRENYHNLVITDQLQTAGFTYDKSSFKVEQVKWTWNGSNWDNQLVTDMSDDILPSFNDPNNPTSFTINLGDAGNKGYLILYSILYNGKTASELTEEQRPARGSIIRNSATLKSSNHSPINYPQTLVVQSAGGVDTGRKFDLIVHKKDPAGRALSGAEFQLTNNVDNNESFSATTDNDGNASFTGLLRGEYTLHEVTAPNGYQLAEDQTVTIGSDQPAEVTVVDAKLISISVTKVWKDGLSHHDPIEVELLIDNHSTGKTITLSDRNNWQGSFTDLAPNQHYSVKEVTVSGYESVVSGDVEHGFTVTNTPITTNVKVTKVWKDNSNQDGKRPTSVEVQLRQTVTSADGKTTTVNYGQPVAVSGSGNSWTYTWTNLPKYQNDHLVVYTVEEVTVPKGYTVDYNQKTLTITNYHTPETVNKTINKIWSDGDNQDGLRPDSIQVNLLANGRPVDRVTLTAGDHDWTHTWTNLPKYEDGKLIDYSVEEVVPTGYTVSYDQSTLTITNTHIPATVAKTVTKKWVDNNDQDGLRPNSIQVNLLANGALAQTLTLTAANNWTATVNDLPVKANGQTIDYTWQEANVPAGYEVSVDGDLITNTHVPATITKTVTKKWVDNNNQDGLRPASITVNLLANGQVVRTLTLNAANNWTATVTGLAQKANGQDINYTWREVNVPAGYEASVDGNLITNTHTPTTLAKTVTKQWVDNKNQDGLRPNSIQVNLLANGVLEQTLTLTAANNWTATVNDLPAKANGQTIDYTWQEANVPAGYEASVDGDLIINTHTPTTIAKTVTKQWVDNNDQDGLRPASITVNLLANGKVVRTLTLNAANGWTATVNDLPAKANGQTIDYTWQEANVPAGYEVSVDGNLITNTHIPAMITKTVTKQWVDNNNQDGLRPASITVNLLANGQVVRILTLNAANNWTAMVTGLAQKADGQDIKYTWQEANVPAGYEVSVDGDLITNTHTPTTTSLTVNKVWDDANNQDGIRPASVTIDLLANGKVVETAVLTAANNWTTSWNDLPVYQSGKQIAYTVVEANVPAGYQSMVSQNGHSFMVTNTHEPVTPTTPTTPDTPNVSNTPTTPTTPNVPGTPVTPGRPGTPVIPGQPNVPVQPQTPVQPVQPGMPKQPAGQGQSRLPQTGNHDGLALMVLGLTMLSLTLGVVKLHN